MREIRTSGSVGALGGNSQGDLAVLSGELIYFCGNANPRVYIEGGPHFFAFFRGNLTFLQSPEESLVQRVQRKMALRPAASGCVG
jgi:hypothetical protein